MAKLNEVTTVKLVDVKNNTEVVYQTTTEPKKSTWGNSYFGTLNSKGIAKLQAKGFVVNNEEEWVALLAKSFGLTEDDIGDRGAKWDTVEARENLKVYMNDIEYAPEFSAKQIARQQSVAHSAPKVNVPQIDAPSITPTPAPVMSVPVAPQMSIPMPPVEAVADTVQISVPMPPQAVVPQPQIVVPLPQVELTAVENAFVAQMKQHKASGKFTKEQLVNELVKQVSAEKADIIYGLA